MYRGLQIANFKKLTGIRELVKIRILLEIEAVVCVALFLMAPGAEAFFNLDSKDEGSAICRLVGKVTSSVRSSRGKAKGFKGVSDKIKIQFDADNSKKCERMIRSYCRENILKLRDKPNGLNGVFIPAYSRENDTREKSAKGEPIPSHKYEVTESCQIIVQ